MLKKVAFWSWPIGQLWMLAQPTSNRWAIVGRSANLNMIKLAFRSNFSLVFSIFELASRPTFNQWVGRKAVFGPLIKSWPSNLAIQLFFTFFFLYRSKSIIQQNSPIFSSKLILSQSHIFDQMETNLRWDECLQNSLDVIYCLTFCLLLTHIFVYSVSIRPKSRAKFGIVHFWNNLKAKKLLGYIQIWK